MIERCIEPIQTCSLLFAIGAWTHIAATEKYQTITTKNSIGYNIVVNSGWKNYRYPTSSFNGIGVESSRANNSGAMSHGLLAMTTGN
jgi:hypothetical protein